MITTINEWKKYKLNEAKKPHNIFVPTRLDTRDMERAKQLTAQLYKELESTNQVTSELLEDLLKFNPQFKIPDNLTVNGSLYLNNTLITSLPDNLTVNNGDLWLDNTPISKNKELLIKYKKKYRIIC